MKRLKIKTSIYVAQNLFERANAYKQSTGLSFNTIAVLALEDYLQQKDRQELVHKTMELNKHLNKPK